MVATTSISETRTLLRGVRWETYQALVLDLEDSPGKRLAYDRGILEIMTPSPEHENYKEFLGRILETTTEALGLEIASFGSTTLSREDLQKGIEPDKCYYITGEALVRGRTKFDFVVDPAPDIAIEIDITSSSLNRLSIYAALGIKEVWRFNGERLFIYCLEEQGYQERDLSSILPVLSKAVILEFLKKKETTGENALIRELRQWLGEQIQDR